MNDVKEKINVSCESFICKPDPFRVRVVRKDFMARCLVCNQLFKRHNKDGQDKDICDGIG